MLKFECQKCKRQFLYSAKISHFLEPKDLAIDEDTTTKVADTIETHVCPYCHSLDLMDAPPQEQIQQPKMVDLVECEVPLVKAYLDRGYVVLDRYAKSIRLALYQQAGEIEQH